MRTPGFHGRRRTALRRASAVAPALLAGLLIAASGVGLMLTAPAPGAVGGRAADLALAAGSEEVVEGTIEGHSMVPRSAGAPTVPALAYGFRVLGAYATTAGSISGMSFAEGNSSTCSTPNANGSRADPLALSASGSIVCLNAAKDGVISSVWSTDLTNATTYTAGSTTVRGCPPVPPATNATTCPYFGSNAFTGYLSDWTSGLPRNTSTIWSPGETGLEPDDLVFDLALSANASAPRNTEYAVTVDLPGATPVPETIYVRTPVSAGGAASTLSVLFDESLAWLTLAENSSTATTYAAISGFSVEVGYASPCSSCFVSFLATDLPTGAEWSVALAGPSGNSSLATFGTDLSFDVANATYRYAVGPLDGCTVNASPGDLVVQGADLQVALNFSQYTCVAQFTETGLAPGTNWSVVVDGAGRSSSGSSILFNEPDGTYAYTVLGMAGYRVAPASGFVAIRAAGNVTPVTFVRSTPVSGWFGLPAGEGYAVAGALAGAAVLAAAVAILGTRRTRRVPP